MAGAVYITDDPTPDATSSSSPTTGPGGGTQPVGPSAGQQTLDFLTAVRNAPGANDNKGAAAPPPAADPGQSTLDFLQGVKDGTLPPPKKPVSYETTPTSIGTNVASGLSKGIVNTLGLPGDLIQGGTNLVVRGINAATGSNLPTPESPIGSAAIGRGLGAATQPLVDAGITHVTANPNDVVPQNAAERIAQGIGEGASSAIAPEPMLIGMGRLGLAQAAPAATQALTKAFGSGVSPAATAANAAVGAVAGGAGETAAAAVPDDFAKLRPIARMVGALGVGAAGALGAEAPTLAKQAVAAGRDYAAPLTSQGQQELAERIFAKGTANPEEATQALQNVQPGVGGVTPLTSEVAGDHGINAMQRAAETGNAVPFNERRAAQNEARVATVKALQPTGDPAAVSGHIRDQLADIDQMTGAVQRQAQAGAQGAAANIGASGTPESLGASMRGSLADRNAAAKVREGALWKAVDPDGKLAMGAAPITNGARRIEATVPKAAKGPEGEEAAILEAAKNLDGVSKFSEITALRSRISDEMRAQRGPNGNPTVLARLTQLRGVVERAIEDAAEHKAGQEAEAVKSGAISPEDTMAAKLQAKVDAFRQTKSETAGPNARGNSTSDSGGGSSGVRVASGTAIPVSGRSGNASGSSGLPSDAAPNLDPEAAARIKAASEATKQRAQTFKQGAVGETLAEQGAKGNYRILDSQVGQKFFKPGASGAEAVNTFKTAVGNDKEAMQSLEGFAGLSLRKAAMNSDGTLDPGKFASWSKAHADALRAMPEVAAKFATAAKASDAVEASTAMRSAALDGYQKGVLGKFMNVSDPGDVTRTVGEIFGRKDAIQAMRQLSSEVASNPDARDGLKKAVADYMVSKFVSNSADVKSDAFQTFVRQNRPVLAQVFKGDDLKGIDAVAAELANVSRLAKQSALPGRSTTAQDMLKAVKDAGKGGHLSLFSEAAIGAGTLGSTGFEAFGVPGAIAGGAAGAAAAGAKHWLSSARAAGMENVQSLVRGMLLDPELARAALERAPVEKTASRDIRFSQQLRRVTAIAASRMVSNRQDARQ